MAVLVDTQLLVWAASNPKRLSDRARTVLENPQIPLYFSIATIWEVAIKTSRPNSNLKIPPEQLRNSCLESGIRELAIAPGHCYAVLELPHIHRDPFDRMLIAQARSEGMRLLTADKELPEYGPPVELV